MNDCDTCKFEDRWKDRDGSYYGHLCSVECKDNTLNGITDISDIEYESIKKRGCKFYIGV